MSDNRRSPTETPGRRPRVDRGTVEGTPHARPTETACNDPNRQPFEVTMEEVLSRENMLAAHKRVLQNGGAPGVDGQTVNDLWDLCLDQWEAIRKKLLSGTYQPQPVRKVEIPKPGGGKRMLGIPHSARSIDSTSAAASAQPALRSNVFGRQLWLSSGAKCT